MNLKKNFILFFLVVTIIPFSTGGIETGIAGEIGIDLGTPAQVFFNTTASVNNSGLLGGIPASGFWQAVASQSGLTGDKNGSYKLFTTSTIRPDGGILDSSGVLRYHPSNAMVYYNDGTSDAWSIDTGIFSDQSNVDSYNIFTRQIKDNVEALSFDGIQREIWRSGGVISIDGEVSQLINESNSILADWSGFGFEIGGAGGGSDNAKLYVQDGRGDYMNTLGNTYGLEVYISNNDRTAIRGNNNANGLTGQLGTSSAGVVGTVFNDGSGYVAGDFSHTNSNSVTLATDNSVAVITRGGSESLNLFDIDNNYAINYYDGSNYDFTVDYDGNIVSTGNSTIAGTGTDGYHQVLQVADSLGLEVLGFDNRNDKYAKLFVNSAGSAVFEANGNLLFNGLNNYFRTPGSTRFQSGGDNSNYIRMSTTATKVQMLVDGTKQFEITSDLGNVSFAGDDIITTGYAKADNFTTSDGGKLWSNSTCTFLSSPDGLNKLEICN